MTVALARPVPNLIGETRVGDTIAALQPDGKRSAEFPLLVASRFAKMSIAVDGNGGAAPTTRALLRGAIYQGNVLIGTGDEVVVMSGQSLQWVDLPVTASNPGGIAALAGQVEFAVIVGGDANVLRVAQIDPDPPYGGGRSNADTYSDGPTNPYGSATPTSATMSIFGTVMADWTERPATSFDVIARMGFAEAQALLVGQLQNDETFETTTSWHGTSVDDNRGSFAVVLSGGPLASLVGQRIQVQSKTTGRTVLVYVTAALPTLDADISLARRAFAQLELLSADFLDVHVQVVA